MEAVSTRELAQQLLRFDTINPPGNEAACMQFLADWLREQGFEVSLTSFGTGRWNAVARLVGTGPGKPLAFTGHLDTVPSAVPHGTTILSVRSKRIDCTDADRAI